MYFDFKWNPGVMTAEPVGQWPILLHALCSWSWPALLKIAPQTPPPAQRPSLAALTIASVSRSVMLIFLISIVLILQPLVGDGDTRRQGTVLRLLFQTIYERQGTVPMSLSLAFVIEQPGRND